MIEIVSIDTLLKMNLAIPAYQRPYKWTVRNIQDLFLDIKTSINESEKYHSNFKYRIGTIILHEEKGELNIVDGQQRIISLLLINRYLNPNYNCNILQKEFTNKISQLNIQANNKFIEEWFSVNNEYEEEFRNAMNNILEVVVITLNGKISEAFQLFDSQNTRGKELDPHDLLKAYHLREMREDRYEMEHAVKKWEAKNTKMISDLFDLYLFPVWNWSRGFKSWKFTSKDIDTYKGIVSNSNYSYAKRAGKAMPYFQLTEPFIAGNDFFELVDHYMNLLADVKTEIEKNFPELFEIIDIKNHSVGFGYSINLFYCILLMFYDKFHIFDKMAIRKMFNWAFMIRVDMEHLGFDTINKYAIGEDNNYSNCTPLFSKIALARLHTEISNLQIKIICNNEKELNKERKTLLLNLRKLNECGRT